ncbi:MAG: DNA-binding response regulator [Omnitrophica WOR_2 bacterium RIFOXYB2_FULL_38_16]|nr:MAG: DNA-binding response regulator [Omnitrophica WOR_2 bacterium RIFOXYA2_FULL_38_17]OGX59007.1 MAG: DNA-binding response regulator [Omnitrophica WOR_2 bacterium RIFOXYB2_FULL_38_16]
MNETGISSGVRILIVDDEKAIRRFLKTSLSSQGYEVAEAKNGTEALTALKSFRPDAVVLDLGLPDMDGVVVTKKIRELTQTPIVIVSVRDQETDKINALDAGADDYLTKPFSAPELFARLRAVMRRLARVQDDPVFNIDDLMVDLSKRLVKVKGTEIRLTPTEYDVLKVLVLNAGKVITHQQIIKQVWSKNQKDYEGIEHLLRVTVSNLRNKLEPDPSRPTYILTDAGVGYRLKFEA